MRNTTKKMRVDIDRDLCPFTCPFFHVISSCSNQPWCSMDNHRLRTFEYKPPSTIKRTVKFLISNFKKKIEAMISPYNKPYIPSSKLYFEAIPNSDKVRVCLRSDRCRQLYETPDKITCLVKHHLDSHRR